MKTFVLLIGVLGSACAPATVGSQLTVPKDAAARCSSYCSDIGLSLNAVVIMASNVGCVCSAAAGSPGGAVSSGGMAAVLMQEAAQRQHTTTTTSQPIHH